MHLERLYNLSLLSAQINYVKTLITTSDLLMNLQKTSFMKYRVIYKLCIPLFYYLFKHH